MKDAGGPGRPPKFCRRVCRQRAYEARRRIIVRDIAERDAWTCHLCGQPVPPEARAPDPLAGTVDHVLPLRRGGGDDADNVRLAHLACNSLKRDRGVGEIAPSRFRELYDSLVAEEKQEQERCRRCGRAFAVQRTGRPRQYCRDSCRQMDYQARRRAKELGLNESELIMARSELDQLRDALYVLEAAVEDVERDLAATQDDPAEVRRALNWLLEAARPLLQLRP